MTDHQAEQLTPYSFRHRYAKGMHAANVPIANICEAMGHTIEVHLKSYAHFKPNSTADIIAAVTEASKGLETKLVTTVQEQRKNSCKPPPRTRTPRGHP